MIYKTRLTFVVENGKLLEKERILSMFSRDPIKPARVRRPVGSFSWLDHRLLSDGFLQEMSSQEILLYFFLVLVGDRNGISFYSHDRIRAYLKLDVYDYQRAREKLIRKSLIACEGIRVQVLALPEATKKKTTGNSSPIAVKTDTPEESRQDSFKSIAEIMQEMVNRKVNR